MQDDLHLRPTLVDLDKLDERADFLEEGPQPGAAVVLVIERVFAEHHRHLRYVKLLLERVLARQVLVHEHPDSCGHLIHQSPPFNIFWLMGAFVLHTPGIEKWRNRRDNPVIDHRVYDRLVE